MRRAPAMRKINPRNFGVARRGTAREINRQIVLALITEHQPVSRADLARMMDTNRANVSLIVNKMIAEGLVTEDTVGHIARGRKPRLLQINVQQRCVVAVDIRPTTTYLALTDLLAQHLSAIESWPTPRTPAAFVGALAERATTLLRERARHLTCEGVGVVVPGIVDPDGGVVLAPHLGWRDVPLAAMLAAALGLQVKVEHSGRACALAQVWMTRGDAMAVNDLVYVSVSDGIGVGVVINGELIHGNRDGAGQYGHVPLNIDGPRCSCGATGCWETYVSNLATLTRYWGPYDPSAERRPDRTITDLVARARGGDGKALAALLATGRYLGIGFATIVSTVDPTCIYVGGEITAAWDLIGATVDQALAERTLGRGTPPDLIRLVSPADSPRLRGAAALIAAPAFAAPRVA